MAAHAAAAGDRPELAHIFLRHGAEYQQAHRLAPVQYRAMRAIAACRTEALGGHLTQCDACGAQRYAYHSCRNRHCPKCQTLAKERWLAARRAELLPVPYFHLVFTLPHELNALTQGNPRVIYGLLFGSVSATLIEFGANAHWLGGEIAASLILHTWGQTLTQHLHLHCLVAAGALHADGHWIGASRGFLFPVQGLSKVFRGKFMAGFAQALDAGHIKLDGSTGALAEPAARRRFVDDLRHHDWVVYAKQPFGGPQQVLDYLGRYTHRVAISNNRLAGFDDQQVWFRYKDYAHGNRRKVLTLEAGEFIRRFLLHVLPKGFMRIRHYGLLANRAKHSKLAAARLALEQPPATAPPPAPESVEAFWLRVASLDIHQCPRCHEGQMRLISSLPSPSARGPPALIRA
jgi:hypothetical protein